MLFRSYRPLWPTITPNVWETTTTFTPEKQATALEAFEELCKAARKLDDLLGLADCEDPTKSEWLKKVKEQVREHEISKIDDRLK